MPDEVTHAELHADIKVLQSQMESVHKRLDANGQEAREANKKIDALSNQLKGANILFAGAMALGGAVITWLASLGFTHR